MKVTKSLAELQKDHVVMELECIDRMYLNAYVPQLSSGLLPRIFGTPLCLDQANRGHDPGFPQVHRGFIRIGFSGSCIYH
jgi:hypothetical protein